MNGAHAHLLVNHFPIVGAFLGVVLLLLALATRRDRGVWTAGVAVLALSAAGAGAAQLTGEPAEEVVEDLAGFDETLVEEHEERAKIATIGSVTVGVVALGAWFAGRRKAAIPTAYVGGVLAVALVSAGLMAWTGNAGGKIRHPEIGDAPPVEGPGARAEGAAAGERRMGTNGEGLSREHEDE